MSLSCINVVGTVISPNPQIGANNFFGVNVSLDPWPVDENVTVTGYLRDDNNITNIYDFNLTINTGTQSAETANNVLVCDPTADATIFITGVTPTTVTYTGTSYPICGYEVTPTPTETPTPTTTPTPSVTPPPCDCNYLYLNVSQTDLDDATGNTDPNFNGKVFIDYTNCNSNPAQFQTSSAGIVNTTDCYLLSVGPSMYYWKNDAQSLPISSYYPNGCCSVVTPTPTPTNTGTPPITPSVTQTQTQTQSQTPTEIPDQYQFQDCCYGTIFRYSNIPGTWLVGDVLYITGGVGFNGCAEIVTNTSSGPLYSSVGVSFTDLISVCCV